jgi:hypothetical protein
MYTFGVKLRRALSGRYDLKASAVWRVRNLANAMLRGLPTERSANTALVSQFEAFGDNCEFAFVQHYYHANLLGLFRFAQISADGLIEALGSRFCDLTSAKYLTIALDEASDRNNKGYRELVAYHKKYESTFHTYVFHGDPKSPDAQREVTTRLRFLARKLIEDLEAGKKIFVHKDTRPARESKGVELCAALRCHGPNTLLWVSPAQSGHLPGSVEWVGDGLMQGYIDRLWDPPNPISYENWLMICRTARSLWISGPPAQFATSEVQARER